MKMEEKAESGDGGSYKKTNMTKISIYKLSKNAGVIIY